MQNWRSRCRAVACLSERRHALVHAANAGTYDPAATETLMRSTASSRFSCSSCAVSSRTSFAPRPLAMVFWWVYTRYGKRAMCVKIARQRDGLGARSGSEVNWLAVPAERAGTSSREAVDPAPSNLLRLRHTPPSPQISTPAFRCPQGCHPVQTTLHRATVVGSPADRVAGLKEQRRWCRHTVP